MEDDLSGYEQKRVKGLWYETGEGDLVVGRSKPKDGTGDTDRRADQVHAYARTKNWIASGNNILRFRVTALTSYVAGSVNIGILRRDRCIRLDLSMGDFLFSIGEKSEGTKIKGVNASLRGLREREGALPGACPGANIEFGEQRTYFDFEISIDGCEASVTIDGKFLGCYRTPDGAPIEGHIGFATSQGAWRIGRPAIRNVRASTAVGARELPRLIRDHASTFAPDRLVHRTFHGLPTEPTGTLVVVLPLYKEKNDPSKPASIEEHLTWAEQLASTASECIDRSETKTPWMLLIPSMLHKEKLDAIKKAADALKYPPTSILPHGMRTIHYTDDGPDKQPVPTILFLDPAGGIRTLREFSSVGQGLAAELIRWVEIYAAVARAPAR